MSSFPSIFIRVTFILAMFLGWPHLYSQEEGGGDPVDETVKAPAEPEKPWVRASEWEADASQWALADYKNSLEKHKAEVAEIQKELEAGAVALDPALATAGQSKGLLTFCRPIYQTCIRNKAPTAAEVNTTKVTAELAADEWESIQVGLWALKDLKNVSFKLESLVHSDGKYKIEGDHLRHLYAYNLLVPKIQKGRASVDGDIRGRAGKKTKSVVGWSEFPCAFLSLPGIDVAKNNAQGFWVDIYAPADAPAGLYKGDLKVMVDGSESASVAVEVTVHPMVLDQAKDWGRGAFLSKMRTRAELVQMREHGLNMVSMWWNESETNVDMKDGKIVGDFTPYQNYLKLMDELGYDGPHMVFMGGSTPKIENRILRLMKRPEVHNARDKSAGPEFEKLDLSAPFPSHLVSVIRQLHEQLKAVGHGKMGICLLDEPDHEPRPQRRDFYLKVYDMIEKGCPEISTYGVFYHEGDEDRLSHHHAYWCTNRPAKKISEMCKKAGRQLWTYGFGYDYYLTPERRFHYGFVPWAFDATGSFFWANYWQRGSVWDPWSLGETDTVSLYTPKGPLGSSGIKSLRENVDDGRYVRMLTALIQKALNTPNPAAKEEARKHDAFLKTIKTPIFEKMDVRGGKGNLQALDGVTLTAMDGSTLLVQKDANLWEVCEFMRRDIRKRIVSLQGKMK